MRTNWIKHWQSSLRLTDTAESDLILISISITSFIRRKHRTSNIRSRIESTSLGLRYRLICHCLWDIISIRTRAINLQIYGYAWAMIHLFYVQVEQNTEMRSVINWRIEGSYGIDYRISYYDVWSECYFHMHSLITYTIIVNTTAIIFWCSPGDINASRVYFRYVNRSWLLRCCK